MGLRNCRINIVKALSPFCPRRIFGPDSFCRILTSAVERPFDEVLSIPNTF
jgi:hypothetical protein